MNAVYTDLVCLRLELIWTLQPISVALPDGRVKLETFHKNGGERQFGIDLGHFKEIMIHEEHE